MTPDEILDKLKRNDAKISRKTLYNWEKAEVISAAVFRNSRTADYPTIAFSEAYAAYCFTQEGILDPLFMFRVRVDLGAVIKMRAVYQKITQAATEYFLSPWESNKDLQEILCKYFLNSHQAATFSLFGLDNSLYWPRMYNLYLKKAEALK